MASLSLPLVHATTPEGLAKRSLKQLLERGEPEVYSGAGLQYIGMPVGGFFAGTVYLGGDGQLWNWDIFNQGHYGCVERGPAVFMGDILDAGSGANYVDPVRQQSPFRQHFELVLEGEKPRTIRFGDVRFRGEYPVGRVSFGEADADVEMSLEAFSPFCPLEVDSSSRPATTLTFKVTNNGKSSLPLRIQYQTDNPVLAYSKKERDDFILSASQTNVGGVQFSARKRPVKSSTRADILFEDWSSGSYGQWTTTGDAFGTTPRKVSELPTYMGPIDAVSAYVANSHQTRNGEDVAGGDAHIGTLHSPKFTISRKYINLLVGGGAHKNGTCVNLIVNGKVVRTCTGHDNNRMTWQAFSVGEYEGKEAELQVVDQVSGAWGNISLGCVKFVDTPQKLAPLESLPDFGTFCAAVKDGTIYLDVKDNEATVGQRFSLAPGESHEVTLVIGWHFPNCSHRLPGTRNWYASRWIDADDVVVQILEEWENLQAKSRAWNKTWYDSTLPYWFLDRTFVNTSTLATTTCHRFEGGRFYFWEGVGAGEGTCTHVWGYGQAIGRLFPEIERYLRKEIDFGMAFHEDTGAIDYRAEYGRMMFVDGQASCILRAYREHQMSVDSSFLQALWPKVKLAMTCLINRDSNRDGILEGAQYNTLDTAWYGEIAWTSSLYIAALRAAEAMANEMADADFAKECATIADAGERKLMSELFNGEFFYSKRDPAHPEANSSGLGCQIDQIYGQSWAHQVSLPRVVPADKAVSALKSLYRYNFYEDVWQYRRKNHIVPGGRWYATPKESGLIMCTFPKGGAEESMAKGPDAWAVGYSNECMSGFEWQVANHMISEGLVEEGLRLSRAIHERYDAAKRNPYNEVEYSDHYGRATASYGAFISMCGFKNHGPKKEMSFSPKVTGKTFQCAFVNEQGWGTFSRSSSGKESVVYRFRNDKLV